MVKTTPMDEKTHMFFKKTQIALYEKYKISLTMSDLMADISYVLKHPEEAARMILRARHVKQDEVVSDETKSKDVGGHKSDNANILNSKIPLVEKEDMNA